MSYLSLNQIFEQKVRVLDALKRTVSPLSPSQAEYRVSDETWSISEIVEHLPLVESRIQRLISVTSLRLERSGSFAPPGTKQGVQLPDAAGSPDLLKIRTQKEYEPTGTVSLHDSVAKLQTIHDDLFALRPRLERISLNAVSFDHWLLGSLTLGQWLAFIGMHEERHLGQIQAVLASPRFPSQ